MTSPRIFVVIWNWSKVRPGFSHGKDRKQYQRGVFARQWFLRSSHWILKQ
jgi:hypothetical protein